jgi:hypothetical protein
MNTTDLILNVPGFNLGQDTTKCVPQSPPYTRIACLLTIHEQLLHLSTKYSLYLFIKLFPPA